MVIYKFLPAALIAAGIFGAVAASRADEGTLPALGDSGAGAEAPAQFASGIVVIRGSDADDSSLEALPAIVTVDRGTSVTIVRGGTPPPPPAVEMAAPVSQVLAGDVLWRIDGETGRVSACHLLMTTQVGEYAVNCTSRRANRFTIY